MEHLRDQWDAVERTYVRWTHQHVQLVDGFIGVAVAGTGLAASDDASGGLGAVAIGAALVVRRQFPTACYTGVFALAALTGRHDAWGTFVGLLIAAVTLAIHARRRVASFLLMLVTIVIITFEFGGGLSFIPEGAVPFLLLGSIWLGGSAIARRQRSLDEAEERSRLRQREHDQERQLALARQRAQIAGELHDLVTHSVSVMLVQAGAARTKLKRDPGATEQALLAVEATGREALQELRGFLGVLDGDGGAPPDLAPQPGVADLELLLRRVNDVGLPVELAMRGDHRVLPPPADLAAYRIVQEALTNALKYAGHALTEVVLDYCEDGLRIEVVDEGPGRAPGTGGGRGLRGLHDRVAALGGTFEAGRRPSGGFAVRAWLPAVLAS